MGNSFTLDQQRTKEALIALIFCLNRLFYTLQSAFTSIISVLVLRSWLKKEAKINAVKLDTVHCMEHGQGRYFWALAILEQNNGLQTRYL